MDSDYVRQACCAAVLVTAVTLLGIAIETVRMHRLESLARAGEAEVGARALQRANSQRLAVEVARYQEFSREAEAYRRSGGDAALAVVKIGNGIPSRVWLESLNRDPRGFALVGASDSVESLGGAILSLGKTGAPGAASLLAIDNRDVRGGSGVHFSARVDAPGGDAP